MATLNNKVSAVAKGVNRSGNKNYYLWHDKIVIEGNNNHRGTGIMEYKEDLSNEQVSRESIIQEAIRKEEAKRKDLLEKGDEVFQAELEKISIRDLQAKEEKKQERAPKVKETEEINYGERRTRAAQDNKELYKLATVIFSEGVNTKMANELAITDKSKFYETILMAHALGWLQSDHPFYQRAKVFRVSQDNKELSPAELIPRSPLSTEEQQLLELIFIKQNSQVASQTKLRNPDLYRKLKNHWQGLAEEEVHEFKNMPLFRG